MQPDTRSAATPSLRDDLRELAANPVSYGQETHGELHADALAHIERCDEAIRKILEGSEAVRQQGLVEVARLYNGGAPTMKPCENCGHVERIYFQCPACGVSFEVKSETSQRIFCSGYGVAVPAEHPAASPSLRLAYADPPYPGCAHLYPEKTEVDHADLIDTLERDFDGWALSTNENAIGYILSLCPPKVRVLAWCKSNAPPFYSNPIPSWEPVVLKPARVGRPTVRSYLVSEAPTGHRRRGDIPGHKPIAFCEWIIRCLGAERDDTLTDLFPGTGVMGETWERWQRQLTIDSPLVSRGPRREVRERLLRKNHPSLWNEVA